jgi:Zn-dependent protease with chaperone function
MPGIDRILSAFSVDRVYVPGETWRYRVGLLFVTFGMFLLPVLYVALVIGTAFLLKTWAIVGMALFEGVRLNFIFFFLYLATLIPLCILLVFMVLPLFNRRPKVEEAFVLDSPSQSGLREFVLELCTILGARSPHKIYLTNVVNAGASLEPGMMGMFLRRYNLIIGLPLVNGLSMQSFAGVLAHELGHFSQHTGMRLTHIIEVINDWFARIVMVRDSLDEKITAHRQSDDWRTGYQKGCSNLFAQFCAS